MAYSFPFRPWPSSASSVLSVFVFVLLFARCFSQSANATFSLRGFACAKKDAAVHGGTFTVIGDKRLRVDPSQLTTKEGKAKIDALRLDAADKRLVMSVLFPNGGGINCKSSFLSRVQMPDGCVVDESVVALEGRAGQDRFGENCGQGKCAFLNVSCNFLQMTPVEGLPNARHFTMSLWKNISDDDDLLQCEWKAFIDDVVVLLNKAESGAELLVEQCWQKGGILNTKDLLFYALLGGGLIILAAVLTIVIVLVVRQQRKSASHTVAGDDDMDDKRQKKMERPAATRIVVHNCRMGQPAGNPSQMSHEGYSARASEFGVEVPESLLSDRDDGGRGPFIRKAMIAPKFGVEVPESLRSDASRNVTKAHKFGVEVPESLRSDASRKVTKAHKFGVEVPESLRSNGSDDGSGRLLLVAATARPKSAPKKPMPTDEMYAPPKKSARYGTGKKENYAPLPPL
ncbi:hypothetical protein niasHT_004056 [Heterodera trifolii]|uniref:Transmembrane protein n=1 Tax=Heterodera trifolii TaxID=157864 RepID=A0ABD2LZS1_9BILA